MRTSTSSPSTPRSTLAADLDAALPRALQRAYGRLEWAPPLSAGTSVDAATLHTTSGLAVKIQLLSSTDRTLWPTEPRTLIPVSYTHLTLPTKA